MPLMCIVMELEIIPNVILVFQMRHSEIGNTINIRRFARLPLPEPVFITGCLHIYWLPIG